MRLPFCSLSVCFRVPSQMIQNSSVKRYKCTAVSWRSGFYELFSWPPQGSFHFFPSTSVVKSLVSTNIKNSCDAPIAKTSLNKGAAPAVDVGIQSAWRWGHCCLYREPATLLLALPPPLITKAACIRDCQCPIRFQLMTPYTLHPVTQARERGSPAEGKSEWNTPCCTAKCTNLKCAAPLILYMSTPV